MKRLSNDKSFTAGYLAALTIRVYATRDDSSKILLSVKLPKLRYRKFSEKTIWFAFAKAAFVVFSGKPWGGDPKHFKLGNMRYAMQLSSPFTELPNCQNCSVSCNNFQYKISTLNIFQENFHEAMKLWINWFSGFCKQWTLRNAENKDTRTGNHFFY